MSARTALLPVAEELALLRDAIASGRTIRGPLPAREGPVAWYNQQRSEMEDERRRIFEDSLESSPFAAEEGEILAGLDAENEARWGGAESDPSTTAEPLEVAGALRGSTIRALLQSDDCPRGSLSLRGVPIRGSLDLYEVGGIEAVSLYTCDVERDIQLLRCSLRTFVLRACSFGGTGISYGGGPIRLRHCTVDSVTIEDTSMPYHELAIESCSMSGALRVAGCEVYSLRLDDDEFRGELSVHSNSAQSTLSLQRSRIVQEVHGTLEDDAFWRPVLDVSGAKEVTLAGSTFDAAVALHADAAVDLTGTVFRSSLVLDLGTNARVDLTGATVEGALLAGVSTSQSSRSDARPVLDASAARIHRLILPTVAAEVGETRVPDKITAPALRALVEPSFGIIQGLPQEDFDAFSRAHRESPSSELELPNVLSGLIARSQEAEAPHLTVPPGFRALKDFVHGNRPGGVFQPAVGRAFEATLRQHQWDSAADSMGIMTIDERMRARRSWPYQVWRFIKRHTLGHGYKLHRALLFLIAVWAIAAIVVSVAASQFQPAGDAPPSAPGFWGWLYALDVVVAPIGTGQSELWIASAPWLVAAIWVLKILAWGLLALFIAGLAGWVNRDARRPVLE